MNEPLMHAAIALAGRCASERHSVARARAIARKLAHARDLGAGELDVLLDAADRFAAPLALLPERGGEADAAEVVVAAEAPVARRRRRAIIGGFAGLSAMLVAAVVALVIARGTLADERDRAEAARRQDDALARKMAVEISPSRERLAQLEEANKELARELHEALEAASAALAAQARAEAAVQPLVDALKRAQARNEALEKAIGSSALLKPLDGPR